MFFTLATSVKGEEIVRGQLQGLVGGNDAGLVFPRPIQDEGNRRGFSGIVGIQFMGFLDFGVGLVISRFPRSARQANTRLATIPVELIGKG